MATWQDKLSTYATNSGAGQKEIERAQQVFEAKKAAGDMAGANAAHTWANQIRDTMGVSDQYDRATGAAIVPIQNVAPNMVAAPGMDIQANIKAMNEAATKAKIANLDKSRDASLSNIAAERTKVQPRYYQARNDAAVQSAQGAQNFAEFIANRGLKNSGENDQARLMQNIGLQNQIGALKQQEAQAYTDLDRRTTDTENAYQSDIAAANAGAESDYMKNVIEQINKDRTFGLEQSKFDWSKDFNNPQNQGQLLTNKLNALKISAQEIENSYLPQQYKLEVKKLLQEVESGRLAPIKAQAEIDRIKAETAHVGDSAAISGARLGYDIRQDANKNAEQRFSSIVDQINNLYIYQTKDVTGNISGPKSMDSNAIKSYIKNLSTSGQITDVEAKRLLATYGFSF